MRTPIARRAFPAGFAVAARLALIESLANRTDVPSPGAESEVPHFQIAGATALVTPEAERFPQEPDVVVFGLVESTLSLPAGCSMP